MNDSSAAWINAEKYANALSLSCMEGKKEKDWIMTPPTDLAGKEKTLLNEDIYIFIHVQKHENNHLSLCLSFSFFLFHHQHLKALITCQGKKDEGKKKKKKKVSSSSSFGGLAHPRCGSILFLLLSFFSVSNFSFSLEKIKRQDGDWKCFPAVN